MLTAGRVKFFSQQNTAGVSQDKTIAQTIEANVDQILKVKKNIIKP